MTDSFGRTLRQVPGGYDPFTGFALRAALIRFVEDKTVFLPIGLRIANNIARELIKNDSESGNFALPDDLAFEACLKIIDDEIQSYRQLPVQLFSQQSIQLSANPRGLYQPGWVRAMQWIYATETGSSGNDFRDTWLERIESRFGLLGLEPQRLEWHENGIGWVYTCDFGPERLLGCKSCSYTALQAFARSMRDDPLDEEIQPMEILSTPGVDTIDSLSSFLDIPASKTLKAVFLHSEAGHLILALTRGDREISLEKLERKLGEGPLTPASEAEIQAAGAVPGYASPIGLQVQTDQKFEGIIVLADDSIEHGVNFTSGANKADFHFSGVNYPRDFEVTSIADLAMPDEGDRCPQCGEALELRSGILLGGWQDYPQAVHYSDEGGKTEEGTLSTGMVYLEPVLAALIDVYHQDGAANWPARLAPYDVYLVDLKSPQESESLYYLLTQQGLSVLLDDRDVSPGVKFTDADLLGCFLRITASKRNLEKGGAELVCRAAQKHAVLPLEEVAEEAAALKSKFM
jgi:prolyl-tRNA synthetase